MMEEVSHMSSYILRDLPPDIWAKFKARAERQQWPLRALILTLFEMYANDQIQLQASPPRRPETGSKQTP
jgi:hypothetical protein